MNSFPTPGAGLGWKTSTGSVCVNVPVPHALETSSTMLVPGGGEGELSRTRHVCGARHRESKGTSETLSSLLGFADLAQKRGDFWLPTSDEPLQPVCQQR